MSFEDYQQDTSGLIIIAWGRVDSSIMDVRLPEFIFQAAKFSTLKKVAKSRCKTASSESSETVNISIIIDCERGGFPVSHPKTLKKLNFNTLYFKSSEIRLFSSENRIAVAGKRGNLPAQQ
jgi:hypothetical protein